MTCTSEDRIEVAAKLRQIADEHDVIHAFSNADIRYIADLIDKTCKVRDYGHLDEFRVVKGCSVCNCGWYEDVYGRPYAYCPYCGARVVDDDTD